MTVDIKLVEKYDQSVFDDLVKRNLESSGVFIDEGKYRSQGDDSFSTNPRIIRIGAFDQCRLVGLCWGESIGKTRFMMHMSLVEPEYREQGIYSRMLELMIEETGVYDEVDSYHHVFNNRILATKLKRGFYIVGFDQSILIGPRIKMRYFHNQKLLELMKYRVASIADPRKNC